MKIFRNSGVTQIIVNAEVQDDTRGRDKGIVHHFGSEFGQDADMPSLSCHRAGSTRLLESGLPFTSFIRASSYA